MLFQLFLIFFTFVSYVLFFEKSKVAFQNIQNTLISSYLDIEAVFQTIKEIRMDLVDIKKMLRNKPQPIHIETHPVQQEIQLVQENTN